MNKSIKILLAVQLALIALYVASIVFEAGTFGMYYDECISQSLANVCYRWHIPTAQEIIWAIQY